MPLYIFFVFYIHSKASRENVLPSSIQTHQKPEQRTRRTTWICDGAALRDGRPLVPHPLGVLVPYLYMETPAWMMRWDSVAPCDLPADWAAEPSGSSRGFRRIFMVFMIKQNARIKPSKSMKLTKPPYFVNQMAEEVIFSRHEFP